MFALTSVAIASLLACEVHGARVARRSQQDKQVFFAGVPVFNYNDLQTADDAPSEWNIVFKDLATDDDMSAACAELGCLKQGHSSSNGVPFVEVRATPQDLIDFAKMDDWGKRIEFFEPDMLVYPARDMQESDSDSSRLIWNLNIVGRSSAKNSGKGATVYIVDTGVRQSHKDFGGRAKSAYDAFTGKTCKGSSSCAKDKDGHGTHCAGSAVGKTYGVAPSAFVGGIKVLADDGSGGPNSGIAKGMDWAVRSGRRPAVLSMSLSGEGKSSTLKKAVDTTTSQGITVVVAAGNNNKDACGYSPAFVPNAITVGSTDSKDRRSGFSNYGKCTDIWAPGSRILSAGIRSDSSTATMNGTSMACPHVAGAAAVVLSGNSKASPKDVRSKLLKTARSGKISGLKSGDTNKLLSVRGL